MINIEKQMDAVMRCMIADTDEEWEAALAEIREFLAAPVSPSTKKNAEQIIRDVLLDLGVPEHLKGHPYLVTALGAAVEDAGIIDSITGILYPLVAEVHNTTPSRAERAIRHAIEVAWGRGDFDTLMHYFGNTISISKGKPTNREFIARMANVVRAQM